jgi:hypothetical protein
VSAPDPLSALVDQASAGAVLQVQASVLAGALDLWRTRDDTKPQPEARKAANLAMDQIDSMLADLHRLRSRLVSEMRDSDDATAARVDAFLEARRDQPGAADGPP